MGNEHCCALAQTKRAVGGVKRPETGTLDDCAVVEKKETDIVDLIVKVEVAEAKKSEKMPRNSIFDVPVFRIVSGDLDFKD